MAKGKDKIKSGGRGKKGKKGFTRVRLIHAVNAPVRNILPYFTENIDDYRAFKRGEFVLFPDEIVEQIRNIARVTEEEFEAPAEEEIVIPEEEVKEEPSVEEEVKEEEQKTD